MKKVVYLPTYALCIVLEDDFIKGAFLGKESSRRHRILSQYMNHVVLNNYDEQLFFLNIREMNFHSVIRQHPLYYWIEKSKSIVIDDYNDCDGISSKAKSCDERRYYYYRVGMGDFFYNTRSKFYLSMFILNHISFFGVIAEDVFFGRNSYSYDNTISKDISVVNELPKYTKRYYGVNFKAPAYYVRAVINSHAG